MGCRYELSLSARAGPSTVGGGPRGLLAAALVLLTSVVSAGAVELRAIGRFGFDSPGAMVYSPKGSYIAVSAARGEVQVIDANTGAPVVMFSEPIYGAVFSPDERTIAGSVSLRANETGLWDIETGASLGRLEGRGTSLAFSPDGTTLAGVYGEYAADGTPIPNNRQDIALWSVAARRKIAVLGRHRYVNSLAFSPDGATLASGAGGDATIKLWDIASRRELATLNGHVEAVGVVVFSPDGTLLASGSRGGGVKLWDVRSRQEVATLAGHTEWVEAVAFSPDGRTLATGSLDGTTRFWDIASAQATATLPAEEMGPVRMLAFRPDGRSLVTGSSLFIAGAEDHTGNTIRVWDLATLERIDSFGPASFAVSRIAFSPDGRTLASSGGTSHDQVALWDVASGRLLDMLTADGRDAYYLTFNPDGTILATGGGDGVTLWDVASWSPVAFLDGDSPPAFAPDGTLLATGSGDAITLWEFPSLRRVATLLGHGYATFPIAFSPDGRLLAAGGRGRPRDAPHEVWLWDVGVMLGAARAIGRDVPLLPNIARWGGHNEVILGLEFSPDGRLLASGDRDAALRLWDVAARREVANLHARHRPRGIAFSPDGRTLVSTGNGGHGVLWDVSSREEIGTFTGSDRSFPSALAFSPDGTLLATGDRGVFLWRVIGASPDVPAAVDARRKLGSTWASVKDAAVMPHHTAFLPNFPNPFNPETWIPYDLHAATEVTITVHDAGGRVLRTLDLGKRPAGAYRTRGRAAYWDGRNEQGETVSSGVYFVQLVAGDHRSMRRVALLK